MILNVTGSTRGNHKSSTAQPAAEIAKRIHTQQCNDKNKVCGVHVLEVECITKGKVHKRYEFGVKIGVVSTSKESFVAGMKSLPGNPYDGHALAASLDHAHRLTGVALKEVYVDRGDLRHGLTGTVKAWCRCQTRGNGSDQKEDQTAQRSGTGDRTHEERWAFRRKLP